MNSGKLAWTFPATYDATRVHHFELYQQRDGAPVWSLIDNNVPASVREYAMADLDDGLRHFRLVTVQKAQSDQHVMLVSEAMTTYAFSSVPTEPDWPTPPVPTFGWVPA